jgi:hypothetical protein
MVFSLHDVEEVRGLLEAAGFTDVQARSEPETLSPPAAEEFLWQYVYSTPPRGRRGGARRGCSRRPAAGGRHRLGVVRR